MATYSSILAWKIPCTEQPGGLRFMGSQRVRHDMVGLIPESGRSPGEGNGNRFECSCLGNSMDRGAWHAIVPGIVKSQT